MFLIYSTTGPYMAQLCDGFFIPLVTANKSISHFLLVSVDNIITQSCWIEVGAGAPIHLGDLFSELHLSASEARAWPF